MANVLLVELERRRLHPGPMHPCGYTAGMTYWTFSVLRDVLVLVVKLLDSLGLTHWIFDPVLALCSTRHPSPCGYTAGTRTFGLTLIGTSTPS
jgi:hypothetical protein